MNRDDHLKTEETFSCEKQVQKRKEPEEKFWHKPLLVFALVVFLTFGSLNTLPPFILLAVACIASIIGFLYAYWKHRKREEIFTVLLSVVVLIMSILRVYTFYV